MVMFCWKYCKKILYSRIKFSVFTSLRCVCVLQCNNRRHSLIPSSCRALKALISHSSLYELYVRSVCCTVIEKHSMDVCEWQLSSVPVEKQNVAHLHHGQPLPHEVWTNVAEVGTILTRRKSLTVYSEDRCHTNFGRANKIFFFSFCFIRPLLN